MGENVPEVGTPITFRIVEIARIFDSGGDNADSTSS